MSKIFRNDWADVLEPELEKPYYQELRRFLAEEYRSTTIYPDMFDIYNALHYTPLEGTRVVILGQDPYHGPGQAHGLSFSVKPGVEIPPSLHNIYQELRDDIGCPGPSHGSLTHWAEQGVLLLNAVLTVRRAQAASHQNKGWETFTDRVVEAVNQRDTPAVFILWGSHAQRKGANIDTRKHFIIKSPHPSPLSAHRGFFGSKPFSRANEYLQSQGLEPIDWCVPE
ncbi:uracil-DNA glycosylase [Paenibacillus kandeliae]|uniref:uracil-DNA glycosylase n=1 Tax=Paenibacillus kandeliae TaxID=3231269 RepID=UPI003459263D